MPKRPSWFNMRAAADGSGTINIFGDIGGWGVDFQSFQAQLDSLGIGAGGQLNIGLNSDGGDVYQGFAIYQALAMHPAQKTITVMGLAASMASVVFMAGDNRVMPKNSVLMIHNPVGGISGQSDEIVSFGKHVGEMQNKIADAYVSASDGKLTLKAALALMDKQSWIGADQALSLGLATAVSDPVAMAAKIESRYPNAPKFGAFSKGTAAMTKKNDDPNFEGSGGVDTEALAKAGTDAVAAMLAQQKEVRALCTLANASPEVAADFNEKGLTVAQAMAELDKLKKEGKLAVTATKSARGGKAQGGEREEVSARHGVDTGTEAGVIDLNPNKIWDRYNKQGQPGARH